MKREWKPHYPKHRGELPERLVLEMAVARDLYNTWHGSELPLQAKKEWFERALASTAKHYGKEAPERIRALMRQVEHERST